jgi:hypothetical protein
MSTRLNMSQIGGLTGSLSDLETEISIEEYRVDSILYGSNTNLDSFAEASIEISNIKDTVNTVLQGSTSSMDSFFEVYDKILSLESKINVISSGPTGSQGATGPQGATGATGPNYKVIVAACSDETTPLTSGTNKVTFRLPFQMTLTTIRASLTTAQSSGNIFTVDVNVNGSSILSTKLTIDNSEKTSVTAATPTVLSETNLSDDCEISIDIDQIGNSTATGLKVSLIGI